MPLWLIRIIASLIAAIVIAHSASAIVSSGVLRAAISRINPDDPKRQLERSLVDARKHRPGKVVIVGHTSFVNAVRKSCRFDREIIAVPIDSAGWRDYDLVTGYLAALRPATFVFQARPYLWTDMLYPWKPQLTNLLPREGNQEIFPLSDVRVLISALEETARTSTVANAQATGVASFVGASFDPKQAERFTARIARNLAQKRHKADALFVLNPGEIPQDALPQTRDRILETFSRPSRFPGVQLQTVDALSDRFGCNLDSFEPVAQEMRSLGAPTIEEEEDES